MHLTSSLQLGIPKSGPVFIHNCAFSPPGFPYFRVNLINDLNKIKCNIVNQFLGIDINCLFVLFNDIKEIDISENIKNYILNL